MSTKEVTSPSLLKCKENQMSLYYLTYLFIHRTLLSFGVALVYGLVLLIF